MAMYIKLYRKEDGNWEGKEKINLEKLWYLRVNGKVVDIEDCRFGNKESWLFVLDNRNFNKGF